MSSPEVGLSPATKWALAVGCAVSVGNLYYLQPLLADVARDFRIPQGEAGLTVTLGQVGYALGMLLVVPLGDVCERKGLVLASLAASCLAVLATALAPTFATLCAASFALGLATCTPQLLVPFTAHLARPEERGRAVGFVMAGLLLGILLARTIGGLLGELVGWRTVYLLALGATVMLMLAMRALLPSSPPEGKLSYARLLHSLGSLVREESVLRESAAYGATIFASFSAFWTTLSFYMKGLGYESGSVGLFGLIGAAGALAAPVAGRLADRDGPRKTIVVGILSVLAAFAIMTQGSLLALGLGVLLMDVGVQASHISSQSRIYARRPEARNRMNTVYMTTYFVGGSVGSALGAWAWTAFGWSGVCAVGASGAILALGVFVATRSRPRAGG